MHTGDTKGSSTDANVYVVLYDEHDEPSEEYKLDHFLRDDFKCNAVNIFKIDLPSNFNRVVKLKIWTDDAGCSPNWYVDIIKVKQSQNTHANSFPMFRWVVPDEGDGENHYIIMELDTILPQSDPNPMQRVRELERKRQHYQLKYMYDNIPMVEELPSDEEFSTEYKTEIGINVLQNVLLDLKEKIISRNWDSLDDIDDIYDKKRKRPLSAEHWKKDLWFGNQRLVGCNPTFITLCTEIPEKFGVTEEMMEPVLNGETLEMLIEQKRLFYTDLPALDGLEQTGDLQLCSPMALFMLDDKGHLLPVAIQLNQEPGPSNPVFLPTDDENVWLLAKMWYNNADASFHQAVLHLGWTHLLMEGVVIALMRNVSVSHPILKLLKPHTLYLLAINSRAITTLLAEGGWIDTTMSIGASNTYKLVSQFKDVWRFDLHGTPPEEFKSRNVEDPEVLPNYYFRDDSLLIYSIIRNYVNDYVQLYYDCDEALWDDWEIQDWAKEMARETTSGGIGLSGVPEKDGEGGFNTIDDLVMVLSAVIYTCSAGHAAVNFLQYAEYAFPPNYPAQIRGELIRDKEPRTEQDLLQSVPDATTTLSIMTITDILSQRDTNSLGNFETQYIYDPKALEIVDKFRADLQEASITIRKRNRDLIFPYEVLLPENIPNAISI